MTFSKDEIIDSSTILDLLKLSMLIYYFKVDFIFDMRDNTTNLLKNIDVDKVNLPELQKNILREICQNSPYGKLEFFYNNINNGLQTGITISHIHKRISVIFRGTSSKRDWMHSLSFCKSHIGDDIYVHTGLYKQLIENNYCKNIMRDLENIVNEYNEYDIYVSGHSGGGAVACIFAYLFSTRTSKYITVVTFASPRVGNIKWFERFNNKDNLRHYRVINNRDIVTSIPYINYYHVGNTLLLKDDDMYMKKYREKTDSWLNWCCCAYSIMDHNLDNYYYKMALLEFERD